MPPTTRVTRSGRGRRQNDSDQVPHTGLGRSDERPSPSPSKRQKRDHLYAAPSTPLRSQIMRPENMYSFTSNIIDLTSSPTKSPAGSPASKKTTNGIRSTNATSSNGTKRLVVKNFKKTSKADPDQYFNQIWNQLDEALEAIFSRDVKPFSMEQLYRGVENICRQDRAAALFQKLQAKCSEHIVKRVKSILVDLAEGKSDTDVLGATTDAWATWRRQVTTIRSIFYYMDRSYLLHSTAHPSIEQYGIVLFRDSVFSDSVLKPRILQGACTLVSNDRLKTSEGGFVPELFKEAIGMFHTLVVYTKSFEPKLLGESQTFFDDWAVRNSWTLSLTEYIDQCHALFRSENKRCDAFTLDESTRRNLNIQMENHLVMEHQDRLVATVDVIELMDANNVDTLTALFDLLIKKGLTEKIKVPFDKYINSEGGSIVFDEKRQSDMVIRLIQFKRKLDVMLETCFRRDPSINATLREAFETFVNKTKKTDMTWGTDNDKPGEMIAKYVDIILRGGSKAIPDSVASASASNPSNEDDMDDEEADEDAQINSQLDQVLDLFRFVHGKAVFEAFYKKDLARRLLMNRSASADAEKSMLTRLTSECGAGFTHNLEQMFKDIELAREENSSYKTMLEETQKRPPVELNVNVLSAACWPTYPSVDVEVPRNIQKATLDFERHYKMKHSGRKLEWKHALAHCQMKAVFPKGPKEIVFSSFQAIVMLYFNEKTDGEPVAYSELQAATSLTDDELKRTLQSLACAKYRVLTKSLRGKEVNTTDKFVVNLSFTDPKYRIKINQIQLKETKEENKQTHERVAADRQYETQAAIVRIMKSKKKIKHALLNTEVINALKSRGAVNPEDIKKQIEKLIDKDYMERVEDGFYEYIS